MNSPTPLPTLVLTEMQYPKTIGTQRLFPTQSRRTLATRSNFFRTGRLHTNSDSHSCAINTHLSPGRNIDSGPSKLFFSQVPLHRRNRRYSHRRRRSPPHRWLPHLVLRPPIPSEQQPAGSGSTAQLRPAFIWTLRTTTNEPLS